MNIQNLPKKIPVVPLRHDVVFPGLEIPISIVRTKSVNAVLAANKLEDDDSYVIVVAQKEDTPELTDPKNSQLFTTGTLCKVKTLFSKENNFKYQVSFLGLYKFKISSFSEEQLSENNTNGQYLTATGKIQFNEECNEKKHQTLLSNIEKIFQEYYSINHQLDNLDMISASFKRKMDPVGMINLMASVLPLDYKDKQKILEENKIETNLEFLLNKILADVSNKKTQEAVQKRTLEQLNKIQKEGYLREQMKAIQSELGNDSSSLIREYQRKVYQSKMPKDVMKVAESELKKLEQLHPASSEYNVVRNYLDTLISMPWNKSTKDNIDLIQSMSVLNEDHYGLEKAKERIIEYLAVAKMRKTLHGPIICFAGPPGVGKTSLGKSIARTLGRKFARISLGGVRDESEIRGHRRTYVGSMPGKIIQTLKKLEVNNPVILLDEIDKMGKGIQGDPSAAMLEVLDPEQNNTFTDHYLDVPFDLSKVVFICTANVLEDIPSPLRDRMEIIYVNGYTLNEKFHIAKEHLIPKVMKDHGLTSKELTISDKSILDTINSYTRESGVRDLQRKIANLCRVATRKIIEDKKTHIDICQQNLENFLGTPPFSFDKSLETKEPGIATGLAWTAVGGDILSIEANKMKGSGRIIMTGSLGEVMKESAQIALSYIRTHADTLKISEDFDKIDIHLHFPAGAIPKDGPSAGITILTTLVSLFTGKIVNNHLAMTGELSLKGKVLAVGGIKEKVIAAHRSGIKTILLPEANKLNINEVPEEILKELNINFVSEVIDVIGLAISK